MIGCGSSCDSCSTIGADGAAAAGRARYFASDSPGSTISSSLLDPCDAGGRGPLSGRRLSKRPGRHDHHGRRDCRSRVRLDWVGCRDRSCHVSRYRANRCRADSPCGEAYFDGGRLRPPGPLGALRSCWSGTTTATPTTAASETAASTAVTASISTSVAAAGTATVTLASAETLASAIVARAAIVARRILLRRIVMRSKILRRRCVRFGLALFEFVVRLDVGFRRDGHRGGVRCRDALRCRRCRARARRV